jgi:hypothetical protein
MILCDRAIACYKIASHKNRNVWGLAGIFGAHVLYFCRQMLATLVTRVRVREVILYIVITGTGSSYGNVLQGVGLRIHKIT